MQNLKNDLNKQNKISKNCGIISKCSIYELGILDGEERMNESSEMFGVVTVENLFKINDGHSPTDLGN